MANRWNGLGWVDGLLIIVVLAMLSFAALDMIVVSPWMFATVLIVGATVMVTVRLVCSKGEREAWSIRYVTAFVFAMLFGIFSFGTKLFDVPRWLELPILLFVAALMIFMSFVKSDRQPAFRWLVIAMCLGLMVAMFSGSAGAGDTMIAWLQAKFNWTLERARFSTGVFRKSVHVTFYALMFLSMARAAWLARGKWFSSLLAGFIWATGHAAFDETVQSFYSDRTGSFTDYLTDLAGMGIALVLCWIIWGRKSKSPSRA